MEFNPLGITHTTKSRLFSTENNIFKATALTHFSEGIGKDI